jgi:hypothetical protein
VPRSLLAQWNVSEDEASRTAGWNGAQLAVWDWRRLAENVGLLQYPDNDSYWISHVLDPGCLLGHAGVEGTPLLMAASPTIVFLTGSEDV